MYLFTLINYINYMIQNKDLFFAIWFDCRQNKYDLSFCGAVDNPAIKWHFDDGILRIYI